MNWARVWRGLAIVAVALIGLVLGGSASARSARMVGLIEHWDGTSWSQVATPFSGSGFTAVVASTATDVWAFSWSRLAEHWNGTTWQRVSLPVPDGWAAPFFLGAAAVSPDDIWAVGEASPKNGPTQAIIDHWNGRAWQQVPTSLQGVPSSLSGVAALSADDVWAVGNRSVHTAQGTELLTLTLHWNGTAWKQVPNPNPPTGTTPATLVENMLNAVAGSSSRDVWAVGQYYISTQYIHRARALILHWNGSRWQLVPSPAPVLRRPSYLYGVAAPSGQGAWAVGSINSRSGAAQALAEHWNGERWSVVHVRGPRLVGVSALAADDAWAASGPSWGGSVRRWNGHRWVVVTKLASKYRLSAVAEVSPTDVWAVGGLVK